MKPEVQDILDFRSMVAADESFIFATWLKGLRFGNDWFGFIPANTYYRVYHEVVKQILDRPSSFVSVACLKEDPDVIVGYSVREGETLHWVFVKPEWRNVGIADALTQGAVTATHMTKPGKAVCIKRKIEFNPFAI